MTAPVVTRGPGWRGVALGMFAVAFGANQFVSILVLYRTTRGVSTAVNDGLFGIYAVSLILALLFGGPAADRWGRASVVRPSVVVSAVASVLLMLGDDSVPLLFAGRFLAGVASGGIFAAGSAWVKELSTDGGETAGARRAALALSAGFGGGPLIAGLVAQWVPHPLVFAYVPHLVITLIALPAVFAAPETLRRAASPARSPSFVSRLRVPSAGQPRFRRVVAPAAPWVFGAPSIAFVVLPALVLARVHGYAVVYTAAVAAVTLGSGVAIQPLARRVDRPGRITGLMLALGATVLGCVVGVLAALTHDAVLVVVAAVPLGAGYGLGLVSGLLETQRLAGPDDLAGLTAVYYALTYVGFALPLALAWLHVYWSYATMLTGVAVLAALCAAIVVGGRRLPGGQPGVLRSESAADTR